MLFYENEEIIYVAVWKIHVVFFVLIFILLKKYLPPTNTRPKIKTQMPKKPILSKKQRENRWHVKLRFRMLEVADKQKIIVVLVI